MTTIVAGVTQTSGYQLIADQTGTLVIQTGSGTTALYIDSSQNVGIGTSSPSSYGKFAVASSTAGSAVVSIQDTSGGSAAPLLRFGVNSSNGFNTSDAARIWTVASSSSVANMNFAAYNGGTPSSAAMTLTGNALGIGNTPFQYGASGSVAAELSIQSSNTTNAALTIQSGLSRFWVATQYTTNQLQIGGNGASMPSIGVINVDATNNVGINTSVVNVYDAVATSRPLVVARSDTSTSNIGSAASLTISNLDTTTSNVSQINFAAITGANTNHFSSAIISAIHGARVNGQYPTGQLTFSTSTATNSAPSEKVRINAAGQLLVGGTGSIWDEKLSVLLGTTTNPGLGIYSSSGVYGTGTFSNSGNALIMLQTETTAGTGWRFLTGRAVGGGLQIQIFGNGSIQNALNSYGSTSDIKIKENIVDASNKLSDLLKVRVVNYNLIDDTNKTKQIGVIAQELESIFPGLVEYNPADDLKSVKYSVFVPILIKAIQEQQDIITRLTARIESLENK